MINARKRILITNEFYQPIIGGNLIAQKLAESLVKRGYNITVATTDFKNRDFHTLNGVAIKAFKISGNEVRGFKGEINAYLNFLKESNFDILLNYAAQTWLTDLTFRVLNVIKAKKIFVPLGYSKLKYREYKRYYKELPIHLLKYDHLIYLSAKYQDKIFGDQTGVNNRVKWSIISNAADENEFLNNSNIPSVDFRKKYNINTPFLIVSVSNHVFAKNHYFLWQAVRNLKRFDYTLALIGKSQLWKSCKPFCRMAAKFFKQVKIFDELERSEVISAFKTADLSILTSRVETDPLVMYESFASKTPFISTSVGSVPEFNDYVKIANNPRQMAKAVDHLLSNYSERESMAKKDFCLWQEKYQLSQMIDRYIRIFNDL